METDTKDESSDVIEDSSSVTSSSYASSSEYSDLDPSANGSEDSAQEVGLSSQPSHSLGHGTGKKFFFF
jgi:hypothetical protein